LTRRVLGVAGLAAVMVLAGCETDDERGEPADAVVAIGATGCRRTSTRAVGVVIADDLLATVAHAVAGESEIDVATTDGRELRGVVAAIDTGLDAAIIRVDGLDVVPLPRDEYDGDDEVTLWTADDGVARSEPVEIRRRATVRTTDIYRDGEHLRPGLELRADVEAGESGGGLVGAGGDLLGLVWATSRERDDRAWAMPIEALDPLLAAAASEDPVPAVRCAR
jgi:S1-C subfamily serine protease